MSRRRTILVAPTAMDPRASGLTTIHTTSATGKDTSAPGWAQYDEAFSLAHRQIDAAQDIRVAKALPDPGRVQYVGHPDA